jgi:hypothetical protein
MLRSLSLPGLAVDEDGPVGSQDEPHWHAVRTTVGPDGGQPGHEVAVAAALDVVTPLGRQNGGDGHR